MANGPTEAKGADTAGAGQSQLIRLRAKQHAVGHPVETGLHKRVENAQLGVPRRNGAALLDLHLHHTQQARRRL